MRLGPSLSKQSLSYHCIIRSSTPIVSGMDKARTGESLASGHACMCVSLGEPRAAANGEREICRRDSSGIILEPQGN